MSIDPFGGDPMAPVSLHRYLYANSSPISWNDPTRMFSFGDVMGTINISNTLSATKIALAQVYRKTVGRVVFKFVNRFAIKAINRYLNYHVISGALSANVFLQNISRAPGGKKMIERVLKITSNMLKKPQYQQDQRVFNALQNLLAEAGKF